MPRPQFFDLDERYAKLDGIHDPLVNIRPILDWESLRPMLEAAQAKQRDSAAGRKAFDAVLMFQILALQQLYDLSDDPTEYPIRDLYSFGQFLDLTSKGGAPDAKTRWRYPESLKPAASFDQLFAKLARQIAAEGYVARKDQIVNASPAAAPVPRDSRTENAQLKAGEVPADSSDAKRRQSGVEARWTETSGVSHYGKSHVSIDREHEPSCRRRISDAQLHDSAVLEELLDPGQYGRRHLSR